MYKAYIKSEKWKAMLGKALEMSRKNGLPDKCIEKTARVITSVATCILEPDTEGEKVFFDLWHKASAEEKAVLARLALKMIDQ